MLGFETVQMLLHGGVVDSQELVGRGYHVDAIGLALSALPVHELVHRLIGRRSLEDHAHHQEVRFVAKIVMLKFIDTPDVQLYNADLSSLLLDWIHKMLLAKGYSLPE